MRTICRLVEMNVVKIYEPIRYNVRRIVFIKKKVVKLSVNFILLWEWTWCLRILCWAGLKTAGCCRCRQNTHATTKRHRLDAAICVETHYDVMSILEEDKCRATLHNQLLNSQNLTNWGGTVTPTKIEHQKSFKTVHQPSCFWTEYFGETLFRHQRMVADLRLTDPLPELAAGCVLELEVGFSRSESYIFENSGFQRYMIRFYKHLVQVKGHSQQRIPEVDQSVANQLPSAKDGEGFLQNI